MNAIIERPVLSDEADKMDSAEVSATDLPSPYDPLPFKSPLHFGSLSSTAVFPSRTAPDNVGSSSMQVSVSVELAAKNAILETRRKALESMKLRRAAAKTAQPVSSDILMEVDPKNTPTPDTHTTLPPVTAAEKTIEQEVADLEQEVLDLQSTVNDMDVDEPEEGEIASSSLPTSIPPVISISTPISASLPIIRPARELNRPNAEDLDNRPTSIPSRLLPPSKRRVFGGNAQRPIRLVVKLDDSDSDTDHEDEIPGTANEAETHRLLAEKEEGIRLLKEKIAERLKAKEVKRLQLAEGGDLSSLEGSPTPSESKLPGVPQSAMEVAVAEVTSASGELFLLLTGLSEWTS